ncbi:hypothetical protein BDR04DRAFT_66250 [Suillus decipiens]|nr:hypothetical protein BDR04DRAFT_66250 [Suillus decipiens]
MYQDLLISDILLYIFEYVVEIPPITVSLCRKSFASLAVTCKAFHEPAMDLLWADVYGLEPLFGCVTRLHPLVYPVSWYWDPCAAGVELLSADEACQFLRHSTRIRNLDIADNRPLPLLSVIPVDVCVFPRLQQLRLRSSKYLGLFLSPTLRECTLFSGHANYAISADQLSVLSDRVCSCKQLVTLYCPALNCAAWKHLSNLPTLLEIINIGGSRGAPPLLLEWHIVKFSPFLHLTTLHVSVDSAYTTAILQHLQFASLKCLWISMDVLTSTEAEQFYHALSNCKQTLE